MVVAFLLKEWKFVLVLVLLLGALGYVENLRVTDAHQKQQITQLTADNKTLTDNNTKLNDAIATANAALAATQKAADKQAKDMADTQKKINQQTADLKKKLAAIEATKDPVTCEDTLHYLLNNAGGFPK